MGRCPACQTWESLEEELKAKRPGGGRPPELDLAGAKPTRLDLVERADRGRLSTGSSELDRVLGGGIREGMVVLVGGDPGIGKSTLMLQCLGHLAGLDPPVLYLSGEESVRQIRLRADRLGIEGRGLLLLTETKVERIMAWIEELKPRAMVVDSIQTLACDEGGPGPGSLTQIRESTARLSRLAKGLDMPLFLVGHVTKSGGLAGPKVVEHMVDTVLYFEGHEGQGFRIIRAAKNRFGSTNEIGVFEMGGQGLKPVDNPSAHFLAERPIGQPGSVVVPCLEGSRPILVEIQALVSPSSFTQPRRSALGVDPGRVALLAAVLEKKQGLSLGGQDVYVNAAGGVRITEPGADLGVACALASSLLDRAVEPKTVFLGEVGLAGEVRSVGRAGIRLQEARKLGFERAVVPGRLAAAGRLSGLELIGVDYLGQALRASLG